MSRQTIAISVKASKLTARALAYVVAAVGRKIAKEHRKAQTPHGKQSVRKLMGHGGDTNAIEVDTPKLFDKVARKWGVDYAIRRVGIKISASVQGTAGRRHHRLLCRVFPVGTKTGQVPADTDPGAAPAGRGTGEKQPQRELTKEAAHGDR